MSIEKFVDEQIKRAIEAGEFDNLSGKGKPIDLKAYFETPEDLRMAYSILKSNNFVPEEVEMLKDRSAQNATGSEFRRRTENHTQETNYREDLHPQYAHRETQTQKLNRSYSNLMLALRTVGSVIILPSHQVLDRADRINEYETQPCSQDCWH